MKKNILKIQYGTRNRLLKNHDMVYKEFLSSKIWLETKEYVRQFPEYQSCNVCGSKSNINIHHASYRHMFNNNLKKRKQGLVCLCNHCHLAIHELSQLNNYGLRQAIKKYKKSLVHG